MSAFGPSSGFSEPGSPLMWDLTVTFMVDPYVFMVCLTDDPTMCVAPVERCERIVMIKSPQGTSGADRLTTILD